MGKCDPKNDTYAITQCSFIILDAPTWGHMRFWPSCGTLPVKHKDGCTIKIMLDYILWLNHNTPYANWFITETKKLYASPIFLGKHILPLSIMN